MGGVKSSLVDWALLVVPGVIWGASFLFIAEGLEAVAPNGVTFSRIAIGFLTLSLFPSARRPVARADWAGNGGARRAVARVSAEHVSVCRAARVVGADRHVEWRHAAVCGRGGEPDRASAAGSRGIIVGLVVGFGGAVVMALPAMGGTSSAFGVGLIMAALVSYGIALNIARPLQQRNGAIPVVWRALAVALVLTAPLGLPEVLKGDWTLRPALAMLCLGAGGTAIATILTATAAGRMGATKASATAFLIPVVALILGVVIRHEHVNGDLADRRRDLPAWRGDHPRSARTMLAVFQAPARDGVGRWLAR